LENVIIVSVCTAIVLAMWSYAAAVPSGMHHQQFLDKNFQKNLIICSLGVKYVLELKEVIYNTYFYM
jgi:hypothetical protein